MEYKRRPCLYPISLHCAVSSPSLSLSFSQASCFCQLLVLAWWVQLLRSHPATWLRLSWWGDIAVGVCAFLHFALLKQVLYSSLLALRCGMLIDHPLLEKVFIQTYPYTSRHSVLLSPTSIHNIYIQCIYIIYVHVYILYIYILCVYIIVASFNIGLAYLSIYIYIYIYIYIDIQIYVSMLIYQSVYICLQDVFPSVSFCLLECNKVSRFVSFNLCKCLLLSFTVSFCLFRCGRFKGRRMCGVQRS